METKDQRNKKFVFVPFCALSQAFQAEGIVKNPGGTMKLIIEELLANDVNIIQMPCPESSLRGLLRKPQSIEKYDTKEFREVSKKLAGETAEQIKKIINSGYAVSLILGVELSPACSVKNQYSNKGMYKRPGIFTEELQKNLKKEKIAIPFLGINRRSLESSAKKIKEILK